MMPIRKLLAVAVAAIAILSIWGSTCAAQTSIDFSNSSGAGQVAGLQDQLEKGLKCRRPPEFAFVRAVVQKVNDGAISRQMVVETFAFARRKAHQVGHNYAFPYFQRGLEERAKKAGTPLDIDTTDLYPVVR
jgi:hypothetical protein